MDQIYGHQYECRLTGARRYLYDILTADLGVPVELLAPHMITMPVADERIAVRLQMDLIVIVPPADRSSLVTVEDYASYLARFAGWHFDRRVRT